jgi:Predicted ring-cleavage extradiol dioxygenase
MQVTSLDHLVLTVRDLGATISFYEILGLTHELFTGTDGQERHALTFGCQKINLHEEGKSFLPHAKEPRPGSADFCFLTDMRAEDWLAFLREHEIQIEEGPVARTGATGPLMSVYVRDPDGNLIELAWQM